MKPIAVLRVESPILHPAAAKEGDFVVIYPDRCELVRRVPNNHGAWLSQWRAGRMEAVSEQDEDAMRDLQQQNNGGRRRYAHLSLHR